LAQQGPRLPAGAQLPPFAGQVLFSVPRGRRWLLAEELVSLDTVPRTMCDALSRAFAGSTGVLIAGDVNSGKTTLLQALVAALPAG
jgi:Flp pilus assembly CpaF family ATPase